MTSSPRFKDLPPNPDLHPPRPTRPPSASEAGSHTAGHALSWAEAHQRWLVGGLAVLIVAALGGWSFYAYSQREAARDSHELAEAFGLLEAPIKAASDAALPGKKVSDTAADREEQLLGHVGHPAEFATHQARNEAALAAFAQLATRLGHKNVGPLASVMAGHLETELGQLDKAQTRLTALHNRLPPSSSLFGLVVLRLAAVMEQRGDAQGALAALDPLVTEQNLYLADEAGLMRARLLVDRGEVAAARTALEQVRSRSPSSALMDDIRIALSELPQLSSEPASSTEKAASHHETTVP